MVDGHTLFQWATDLYPMCRSITGPGVRDTLSYIGDRIEGFRVSAIKSGTKVFDWTVPDEWTIRDAFIADTYGCRIVDFKKHNLHVVGYSTPIDEWISREEIERHLYSLPEQPDAIPYVTSYYERRWGFCLPHYQRQSLPDGPFRVYIDADLKSGVLNYGDVVIPATNGSQDEIFISTYICHPSMANNELSGPVVTLGLARWLLGLPVRRYNYRIAFLPETIGALVYLNANLDHLKKHVKAGFNVTCVGDSRTYSYLPSRKGDTLSDRVALHVLKWICPEFKRYSWSQRGSDERQYCAPGVDLPMASIMRSKYGTYPEYHTSLDALGTVVTPEGLEGGFNALRSAIEVLESNCYPMVTVIGEPQLGKYGLYPTLSKKSSEVNVRLILDVISWSDGSNSLLDIAEKVSCPIWALYPIVAKLRQHNLLKDVF